jgi:dynein heavy chain 1
MEVSPPPVQSHAASANGGSAPAPTFPTIEPERVVEHLAAVCQVALGATHEDLEQPGSLLHKSRYSETVSRCTRFANDTQNVLYIQKDVAHSPAAENGADVAGECFQPPRLKQCWIFTNEF